jgi:ribosomal protein S25
MFPTTPCCHHDEFFGLVSAILYGIKDIIFADFVYKYCLRTLSGIKSGVSRNVLKVLNDYSVL